MAKITQEGRLLAITTASDDDFFLLQKVKVREGISELFEIEVELLHEQDDKLKIVEPDEVLGKSVTILVQQKDGGHRYLSGIVNRFSQGRRSVIYSEYSATIVPHVWILTQNSRSRIFQHQSVPDILTQVFEKYEIVDKIQRSDFKERNFVVQYRESDFDFASRLMEEEGIYYYFQHEKGIDKLVLSNVQSGHIDCPNKSEIPVFNEKMGEEDWVSAIVEWRLNYQLQAGKIQIWDHHFQIPTQNHEEIAQSIYSAGNNQEMLIYDFAGGYCRKYDEVDKSGGTTSDLQNISADKQNAVKAMIQARDVLVNQAFAISDCCTITPGHKFKLVNHPVKEQNRQYLIVSAVHEMTQNPPYAGLDETEGYYKNEFVCIPFGEKAPVYRPLRRTATPVVEGTQTATVVGPSGQEIHTDKYGRIKIKFHWDQADDNADNTAWVRVGRDIAGKKWGTMYIPRVGQEVIVDFLYGNPDQPIVVGSVYNQQTMPHYELPKFKTLTYIKTRTSPDDGKGYNELRFEDKAEKEQVFIRSQKRYDLRVRGSMYETCGGSRQEVIGFKQENQPGGNLAVTVAGNYDLHVKENMFIGIDGKLNEGVKGDVVEGYDGNQQTAVKSKVELNAREIVMEALTSISFKVGGNFVKIDLTGVTIVGTLVNINSGGSASGTGSATIDDPLDAETSDTGEPGYLDRPRTGGGGGRHSRTLGGQHAPENITRNADGSYQMGSIKVQGDPAYQQAVLSDLATMNTTPTGRSTLAQLNASGQPTTIRPLVPPANPVNAFAQPGTGTVADYQNATPAGQPVFDGGGNPLNDASGNQLMGTGTGGPSDVQYNPTDWPSPTSTSKAPGDVILLHELNHSVHQQNGNYDGTPRTDGFDTNEEFNAIAPENQYRDERGVPRRTNHHDL